MRRVAILTALLLSACAGSRSSAPAPPPSSVPAGPTDLRARCCAQCSAAAGRDPTGADIGGKACSAYPAQFGGGVGVDDECRAWLLEQPRPLTVRDCRE